MNLSQNVCIDDIYVRVTQDKKIGHQAKSKENLIKTLEVTFLK